MHRTVKAFGTHLKLLPHLDFKTKHEIIQQCLTVGQARSVWTKKIELLIRLAETYQLALSNCKHASTIITELHKDQSSGRHTQRSEPQNHACDPYVIYLLTNLNTLLGDIMKLLNDFY
eukprot:488514_1